MAQTSPLPLVFSLAGTRDEVAAIQNGAAVTPPLQPAGMSGNLVVNGNGTVNFLPQGGVWFGLAGQQRANSAYYQFDGKGIQSLFDPFSAGEVSFTWTSHYSFAERKDLVAQTGNRNIFRTAFEVYNDANLQMLLQVQVNDGFLAFIWRVSDGRSTYCFVPVGSEDAVFGKNVALNVRVAWDGVGQSYLYLNGQLAQTRPYTRSRGSWNDPSFSIGASDRRNFLGGYFSSDDAISNFRIYNSGRLPVPPPEISISSPAEGEAVSGQTTVRVISNSSVAVSTVGFLVDGVLVATRNAYPYHFPWNTRNVANGPHQVEIVSTDVLGGVSRRSLAVHVQNTPSRSLDRRSPDAITGLRTARVTSSEIVFQWDPPKDGGGIGSYHVYRNGLAAGTVAANDNAPAYRDTGLKPGTVYSYQVLASDLAGNASPLSSPIAILTKEKDGNLLRVGPGAQYARPCDALRAAAAYDTVEIDAAGNDTYDGDVCQFDVPALTIRGVNGRARIDAIGQNAGGKATWVVKGADNTIENVELSGAVAPDANGAAIRVEGAGLTLRNVYFHHNQNGLLTANVGGSMLIEYSEFAYNGDGSGQTHNMYINGVNRFTLQFSYSHDASIGHLVKSRATENYILYNRLTGENGTQSYEIDLPNGGPAYIIGNLIEQSPKTDNNIIISYGVEGIPTGRARALYLVHNTVVNMHPTCIVLNMPSGVEPTIIHGNLFPSCSRMFVPESQANVTGNAASDPGLFLDASSYDYRVQPNAATIAGAGTAPADASGQSLAPAFQYVHPTAGQERPPAGSMTAGAYQADEVSTRLRGPSRPF